jgi:ribosomal protein L1
MAEKTEKNKKKAEVVAETVPTEVEAQPKADMTVEKAPKTTAKAGRRSPKAIKEAEAAEAKAVRKSETAKSQSKPAAKQPPRSRLERAGKKYREAAKNIEAGKTYSLREGLEATVKTSPVKFDATVEIHLNLNVDPKQADQNIRGVVALPSGSGKTQKVAIADDKILADLEKGQINFDILIAAPEMMPKLGKYAKLLGPKGLMPNPKSGTVSADTAKAAKEAAGGRTEFRVDSAGIIHVGFGKVSFGVEKLMPNAEAIINAIKAAKPAGIKGNYINSVYLTTTMGPTIKLAPDSL